MDKMYETKHSSDWFYFPMEFVILVYLSFARSHFAMVCVSHTPIVFQLVFVVALPCEFRSLPYREHSILISFIIAHIMHHTYASEALRILYLLFFYCMCFFFSFSSLVYISRSILSAHLFSTLSTWPSWFFFLLSIHRLYCSIVSYICIFNVVSNKTGEKHWKSHKPQRFYRTPFFFLFRLMLLFFFVCAMQSSENKKFIFISHIIKRTFIIEPVCIERCSFVYFFIFTNVMHSSANTYPPSLFAIAVEWL